MDLLRRTLGEAVELVTGPTPGLWLTLVDRGQLESALLNLAINSRDAMPGGGRLTIEATNVTLDEGFGEDDADAPPGDYVMLSVRDNGFGMAARVVARVFEPFFTTKEVGKGSGLGLSMVYGFAKQSGGHVRIESVVGRGTVARLYLPRAAEAPATAPQISPSRSHSPGKGETILVVEDDGAVRDLVTGMLRSLGYETLEAVDAESGLAVLADVSEIDLLFSDVVLSSGPSGPEMAREARALRPGLRMLFMSGYVEGVEGLEEPALCGVGLIQKPFRKAELAEALRAALA